MLGISPRGVILAFVGTSHSAITRFVMEAASAEQGVIPWAFGAAVGELEQVLDDDDRFMHGEPLVLAEILAETASPGELWVAESFMSTAATPPRVSAERSAEGQGGLHVKAYVLRSVAEVDADRAEANADALALAESGSDLARTAATRIKEERSSRMPMVAAPVGSMSERMLSALYRGHEAELDEIFGAVDLDKSEAPLLRMGAVNRLRRGDVRTALAVLHKARAGATDNTSDAKSRTALALAIALMWAGRHDDALNETMEALARARESRHVKGEAACVKVLRLLCERADRTSAASLLAAAES